jgi:hypothetical protein
MYTITKGKPVIGQIKVGDIYERSAFTDEEFKAFIAEWRCQKGTIQDPGTHQGVELVRVIERRCFAL